MLVLADHSRLQIYLFLKLCKCLFTKVSIIFEFYFYAQLVFELDRHFKGFFERNFNTIIFFVESFGILDVFSSRTKRKHLGITMFALDAAALKELKMRNRNFPHVSHGILVHTIQRDSPADK